MPNTEIIRVRNCIQITVILHFHIQLTSKSAILKNVRTKTGKTGLYDYIT